MKRLLAFLILFGLGLALVLALDRRGAPSVSGRVVETMPRDEAGPRAQLRPSGRFAYSHFTALEDGTRVRRYSLASAQSSEHERGGIRLDDLRMELYDETGRNLFSVVEAESGRVQLVILPGEFQPRLSEAIELSDVEIRLLDGVRLVPMFLRTSELSGDLANERFWTAARAHMRGEGIQAQGQGLEADLSAGSVRFLERGRAEVLLEDGTVATLTSGGELVFRRSMDDPAAPLRVRAVQGSRLIVEGSTELVLEAQNIDILGRAGGETSEVLTFERLVAEREVSLRSQGHVFQAQTASFEIDADGQVSEATLSGSPRALLAPQENLRGHEEPIELWGRGPLQLGLQAPGSYQIGGPAQLRSGNTELWASGGISGRSDEEGRPSSFRAWGEVEVRHEGWLLQAPEIEGSSLNDRLVMTARGPARLSGTQADGTEVRLLASGGADFWIEGDDWEVTRAEEVDLTLAGAESLSASAQRIRELRSRVGADELSFRAEGNVEFSSRGSFLKGDWLDVRAMDRYTLGSNTEQAPVSFDSEGMQLRASSIQREGQLLDATGGVRLDLSRPEVDVRLRTDRLSFDGLDEGVRDIQWAPRRLHAVGNVFLEGLLHESETAFELSADELEVQRTHGEPSWREPGSTHFSALGSVRSLIAAPNRRYRVSAERVTARFEDSGMDADYMPIEPRGLLRAQEKVRLEVLDAPVGWVEGADLEIDHLGHGRMLPAPGERVVARGVLPGGNRPFELEADELQRAGDVLIALRGQLAMRDLEGGEALGPAAGAIAPELDAEAERIVLAPGGIEFEGRTRFRGKTARGTPWQLAADSVSLRSTTGDTKQPTALDSLTALGRVHVRFEQSLEAFGDRLEAEGWSQRIRITGEPASIGAAMLFVSSEWFEFDTYNLLPSSGRGVLDPFQRRQRPEWADEVQVR